MAMLVYRRVYIYILYTHNYITHSALWLFRPQSYCFWKEHHFSRVFHQASQSAWRHPAQSSQVEPVHVAPETHGVGFSALPLSGLTNFPGDLSIPKRWVGVATSVFSGHVWTQLTISKRSQASQTCQVVISQTLFVKIWELFESNDSCRWQCVNHESPGGYIPGSSRKT